MINDESNENELDLDKEDIDFENLEVPDVEHENQIESNLHEKIRQQLQNNKKNNINEDKKQIKIEENTAPSINIPKHTIKTSYTDDTTKEKIKNEENNDSDDNENGDDENDENDDDDDDDDDSDEEDTTVAQKKFRPVFLKQAQRENLIERMGMEEELEAIEEDNRKRQEELQKEIRQEVIQYIQNEEENENKKALNIHSDDEMNMPDDNDDTTNIYEMENEFKNWKLRELKRIIEEKETKEQELKEEKELLLRRQMSDKEIEADNRKLGIKQKTEKKSMKFMQKYYHPGVFSKIILLLMKKCYSAISWSLLEKISIQTMRPSLKQ